MTCDEAKAFSGSPLETSTVAENAAFLRHMQSCSPCRMWMMHELAEILPSLTTEQMDYAVRRGCEIAQRIASDPEAR